MAWVSKMGLSMGNDNQRFAIVRPTLIHELNELCSDEHVLLSPKPTFSSPEKLSNIQERNVGS